jgi:anthranilate 1,2-dioxygenase large subunit
MDGTLWPRHDYSRVPYRLYHDPALFDLEQEKIFRGRTWCYLGLDAEIPAPGDFRATYVGDTPVIYNRADDGSLHAFVNRCAHRGAAVRREAYGNARDHVCIYHRWCYDQRGDLIGVPFRRGVKGKGGYPADFATADHGLQKLRVESFHGVIFGTFAADTEPLETYLGPPMAKHLARLMQKPIRILGYQRQRIAGNWKLYQENVRDSYHGSLLHEFQGTFGISRVTQRGGAWMDPRHRHHISYNVEGGDSADSQQLYRDSGVANDRMRLQDMRMLDYHPDFADGIHFTISSYFPNAVIQQIRNSLAIRQIRPVSVDEFELLFTLFGYADDTAEVTALRLRQSNMVGPAGFISMEDGEAIEIAHRATKREATASAVIEMGGRGPIPDEIDFRASDIPIRGFWSSYAELMGMEPKDAIR